MSEKDVLEDIFDDGRRWKNKYKVKWCDLCDCAILICPECKNSTCNGGGCKECHEEFSTFNKKVKSNVHSYLTDDENRVYEKCKTIQEFILESVYLKCSSR